jgi:hypothetical protein
LLISNLTNAGFASVQAYAGFATRLPNPTYIELGDVVNVSSSDNEDSLEFHSLESGREISSQPSVDDTWELSPSSSASSDWFKDWPEANDMAANIYVALTAEPLSSTLHVDLEAIHARVHRWLIPRQAARGLRIMVLAGGNFTPGPPRIRDLMTERRCRRSTYGEPPRKRSKRLKKTAAEGSVVTPSLPGSSLSAVDFDKSEWEIMYALFVESGLVASSERTDS